MIDIGSKAQGNALQESPKLLAFYGNILNWAEDRWEEHCRK
jgi:hypothetical protein